MPKLPGIELRTGGAPPVSRAKAEADPKGLGFPQFGSAVAQVGQMLRKRAEQNEISNVNERMAALQSEFTRKFQDSFQKANPNDTELGQRLVTDFEDRLGQIGGEVSTRGGSLYFQKISAQMKGHFANSAASYQAELAGANAKANYQKAMKSLSSALIDDPSSLKLALEMHDSNLDSLVESGGLPSKAATQLKEAGKTELAKQSIRGWIRLKPEGTKKLLTKGEWDGYIDGDLKKQLMAEADQELRAREVEAERLKKEQERALKESQRVTQNDFLDKLTNNQLSTREILDSNLEAFGSGSKKQFIQMLNSNLSPIDRDDPVVFQSLFDRAHLPDGDPNKLTDENELNAYLGKGLSLNSLKNLRKEVLLKGTRSGETEANLKKSFVDLARGALVKTNPYLGIKDPVGEANYQAFSSEFFDEYEKQRKKGKTPQELLSPTSKDYLGPILFKYQNTPIQIIKNYSKGFADTPAPKEVKKKPTKPIGQRLDELLKEGK